MVKAFLADIKFEHSLFALPFAYLGLFLAENGFPRPRLLFWVTAAMVAFRTFGMAANRLIDRRIDAENPRTARRALPQKKLTPAFVCGIALLSLALFGWASWKLGPLCFFLAPIPILLAAAYPFLKRFTWLSHIVLGIILGISPYGAWLASRAEFSWLPGLLLIGVAAWVAGFDILYALQDFEFDRTHGLYSLPVRFGEKQALATAAFLHLISLAAWTGVGVLAGLGWIYRAGLAVVGFLLVREHWLVNRFGLARIEQAFFTMNVGVSLAVFLSAAAALHFR